MPKFQVKVVRSLKIEYEFVMEAPNRFLASDIAWDYGDDGHLKGQSFVVLEDSLDDSSALAMPDDARVDPGPQMYADEWLSNNPLQVLLMTRDDA